MNPRDIFDYKCSSCKAMWEPQYFGWNQRTGARLKTCNFCRAIRAARAEVRRESGLLEAVPEVTSEPVLWDAAAELNTETSESPRGEPQIVMLPPDSKEAYPTLNPSSSSAADSYYCYEPEPEPPADFGTDTE